MSANLNKGILVGNLVKKPELENPPKGTPYTTLRLAVTRKTKDKEGNSTDHTTFLDVSTWSRTAEFFCKHADKGCSVLIEYRLAVSEWEKDGKKYNKLTIICEEGQLLTWPQDRKNTNRNTNNEQHTDTAGSTERHQQTQSDADTEEEDDIPF